ncbi:hypothetical protein FISHEDRAFT_28695, partial [Fistulina hepatica ATCC 64428]
LEPYSLYILTQPLLHGSFHWSLIFTDASAVATRHHWAEQRHVTRRAESYIMQHIGSVKNKSEHNRIILAFFKIAGLSPIDTARLSNACRAAFPVSYSTVELNRAHGLTCRTWIWDVLRVLKERGNLNRNDSFTDMERSIR